jgi:RNA polymerase sigma-70 factor, ECF subfamily
MLRMKEQELVEKLKNKDIAAFSILYKNYSAALFGIILKIVRTDPPAEDILQEAFLKIWNKIDSYDTKKGTIFTWMLNISRNLGIDSLRSSAYKQSSSTFGIDKNLKIIDYTQNESYPIEFIGLNKLIEVLNPEHKKIIDLIYFGGYTQAEVAEHLNIPLGTVKTRARMAMNQLRMVLKNEI